MVADWDALTPSSLGQSSNAVSIWRDLSGNVRDLSQATSNKQPTFVAQSKSGGSAGYARITCPDLPYSVSGKGFTCTGLARGRDGTWWVGNGGRNLDTDTTYYSGVVQLSADFSTVLRTVYMSSFSPSTLTDIQGVAVDSVGRVAMAHRGDNTIYIVDPVSGSLLEKFTPAPAMNINGLAYDPTQNAWVIIVEDDGGASPQNIRWYKVSDQSLISSKNIAVPGSYSDHLFVDIYGNVYVSSGPNLSKGLITKFDQNANNFLNQWVTDADCIEGIYTDDGRTFWICNDAYRHGGVHGLNEFMKADLVVVPGIRSNVAADTNMTFNMWAAGVNAMFTSASTTVGTNHIGATGTTRSSGAVYDLTVPTLVGYLWTSTGYTFYSNGVPVANGSGTMLSSGAIFAMICATSSGENGGGRLFDNGVLLNNAALNRAVDLDLSSLQVLTGTVSADLRQRMEGYVAHRYNHNMTLPDGHPYKLTPPML
ncbi:hypothetical protein [Asticcacaulis solisilvae]|uniref:hypothetical protein n=1 Tax=Asticcacaulis solisilvae TaxID=1217274 RepID=UPI003FD81463